MIYPLLPIEGSIYKANLHCHTDISDGKMTPEQVKAHYKSLGYHAVCFTDHEVLIAHEELCDKDFVALHGYEVAVKKDQTQHTGQFMPVYHINLIAKEQSTRIMPHFYVNNPSMPGNSREWAEKWGAYDPADTVDVTEYSVEWVNDFIEAANKGGFLVTYNHPQWSLQTAADYLGLRGLFAIEVINGACLSRNDNTSLHFEQMLRGGMDVIPVGGDDNHTAAEIGRAYTAIKAPTLSYDALIKAYERGDCYATEGPQILQLFIEDGEIVVQCSPAASVTLLCEGRYACRRSAQAEVLTEARFPYNPALYGRYFRFEVRDAQGKCAFSRAYLVKDISFA